MSRSPNAPARRRSDAYFTASFEVARRLAEGRGDEAVSVLRKELQRVLESGETTGMRFLLSQIALCYAKMERRSEAEQTLQEMESALPHDPETALLLADGYLFLLGMGERASHHAGLALRWAQELGTDTPELLSKGHNLMARALVASGDLNGAFGAWRMAPLPAWRLAVDLIEAGYRPASVRKVLVEALPRHQKHELEQGAAAAAASDRIRRLLAWIDEGCPAPS